MAGDLKTQIEISADSSGVEAGINKAKRSLADLGATAAKAGKQASEGVEAIGEGGQESAQKLDAATRNIIGSIQRTTAVVEAGSRSNRQYFEVLAAQRGVNTSTLKPYLDQLDAANAKQAVASQSLDKIGLSANQTTAALRQVPAQFTDIFVSLQGGQSPLQVFLQQGGQLKDLFGGIGPAAQALGGYILGLINPFTLLAAAAAGLAFAYKTGSEEADAFNRALILTGNAAGQTMSGLAEMARRLDGVVGTQSEAAAALTEFISAGATGADNLERFAATALRLEKTAGQAVSETAKQFYELGRAPLEASVKLNQATNFLTISLYEQIKALEEQGKTTEAATVAQKAYADAMDSRTGDIVANLGYIEAGWARVTKLTKEAIDEVKNFGRAATSGDKIAELSEQIAQSRAKLERLRLLGGGKDAQLAIASEQARLNAALQTQYALQENARLQSRLASDEAKSAAQAKARIDFDKEGEKFLSDRVKMEREIAEARKKGAAAGASQIEIERRIADITEKYRDKGASRAGAQIGKSQLGFDISSIKAAQAELVGAYANSEKILEAQRATGLVKDREYYEAKRAFIRLNAESEERALIAQIDRLQRENVSGKEKLDNDRKIAETQTKLAQVRQNAVAEQEVLAERERGALEKIQRAYEEARRAADSYLDSINKQFERNLAGIGQGQRFRDQQSGLNQIDDRYEQQRFTLSGELRRGDITPEEYDRQLAIINEFNAKARQSYEDYYARITEAQGDWLNGANEAFNNYITNAGNVALQTESVFMNAFRGMEDALVDFVTTGKLSFREFAQSIIADIIRIQARQAIAGVMGSIFPSAAATSAASSSATASAWSSLVGGGLGLRPPRYHTGGIAGDEVPAILQRGEGVFTASQMKALAPVSDAKASPVNVSVQVDASGAKVAGNAPQSQELGRMIGNAVREVIVREKMPGGMLA
jgi:lambda family phage tail tape measure protein